MQKLQALFWLVLLGVGFPVQAAGPYGADNGWAIDNSGNPLLTTSVASKLVQGETGWLRVEMRLIPGHSTWDAAMLGYYDTAVNNARNAGLQVLLLIDDGSWPGSQSDWCANNSENNPGANGDNAYVEGYATNAVVPIVQHFRDRVKYYELWNEPNCWSSSPSNGVFVGCTYIYPSNYGWLLARSWEAIHFTAQIKDVTLFSGGVFGHNIGGITSYANAGAQYIDDTYSTGTNTHKGASFNYIKTNYNAYPLDGIGEHLYITQGGLVSSNTFRQYEDWVHQACTKYEGASTPKKTFITEFGWQTPSSGGVSQAVQDTNLVTAFSAIQATPYVQMAIWFSWQDNSAAALYFGVLDVSGNTKQSYADYQRFHRFEGVYTNGAGTNVPIQSYFYAAGQGALGCPFDNGRSPWVYPFLNGYAQDFAGGSHQKLALMTSTNGTYEVNDVHGMWSYYLTNNGATAFGYVLDNEFASGSGTRQDFLQGYLTWDATSHVVWHLVNGTPPAPTGLTATPGTGMVTLQWNASPTATSYYVKRAPAAAGPFTNIITSVVGPAIFTDAPLNNGSTYFYVVSALNSVGEGTNSTVVNATPDLIVGNLPTLWLDADIGNVNLNGSAGYSGGRFSVKGAGSDIGLSADAFHFACQPLSGDGTIIAHVKTFQSQQSFDPSAKAGVMIRETLAANAAHVSTVLTASNGVHREYRTMAGGGSGDVTGPAVSVPYWLKLARGGNSFTAFTSSDGVTYAQIGVTTVNMASNAFVGLVVCSHNTNVMDTATFDNVAVTPQVAPASLTATPTNAQVTLVWSAGVPGATNYNVRRALVSGGPYAVVTAGLGTTNYADTALTNGTTYYYVVSATNNAGDGPNSVEVSALPVGPPVITQQPVSQVVAQGDNAWLSVVASSPVNFTYQWQFNGTSVPGATTNLLALPQVQPGDAGRYAVVLSNYGGSVTSFTAVLAVRPLLAMDANGVLSWSGAFVLQSATNVTGPYSDLQGATSPFTNNNSSLPQQFFRLRQ
jgi:regulation of enolase protein 1 (concanavalin A-like superfamily)